MATDVKATCGKCDSNVILKGSEVTCRTGRDGKTGMYEFTCPECGQLSVHVMRPDVSRLLGMATGVKWVYPPAELNERHDGPALTEDDLLAFGLALYASPADYIMARVVL